MTEKTITLQVDGLIERALKATGDSHPEQAGVPASRISHICGRYMELIAAVMPEFTVNEWCAICDANNGVALFDSVSLAGCVANVADSPELKDKWDIDIRALARRMDALPAASKIAIGEVVERFWGAPHLNQGLTMDEQIRLTGARICTSS
jgi:hypothetical protein